MVSTSYLVMVVIACRWANCAYVLIQNVGSWVWQVWLNDFGFKLMNPEVSATWISSSYLLFFRVCVLGCLQRTGWELSEFGKCLITALEKISLKSTVSFQWKSPFFFFCFVWGCCWARNLGQFASLFLFFLAGRRGFTLLALLWQWWIFLRAARGRSEGGAECRCRAPAAAWLASPALKPTFQRPWATVKGDSSNVMNVMTHDLMTMRYLVLPSTESEGHCIVIYGWFYRCAD